jgi:outer membrane protein TolC
LGLQTAWEIDVFGGGRAGRDAAAQSLLGAQADWHEARVSMAAEVAVQYDLLRQCRRLALIGERDAASRAQTARLSERASQAGMTAPALAGLARASAADAASRVQQQLAQCELETQALVALTAWPEPELRQRLAGLPADHALTLPPLSLNPVPAQALAQLAQPTVPSLIGLASDLKGDILTAKDQKSEALTAYQKAWDALSEIPDYRRLVEAKLNALGVDPQATSPSGNVK